MKENKQSVLRLAFVLSDSESKKKNIVLGRLIQSVTVGEGKGEEMTLEAISESIFHAFELTFSNDEILESARETNQQKKEMVFIIRYDDSTKTRYIKPSEKTIERESAHDNKMALKPIIERYIATIGTEELGADITAKEIEDSFTAFLYSIFNSSKREISQLLNKQYNDVKLSTGYLTDQQKKVAVALLEWDDQEKDKIVFSVTKAAYDYCFLSAGENTTNFASVFRGKEFFLDTNVIFAIAGINGDEQRMATQKFIAKCKEQGITICCTNETKEECDRTVKYLATRVSDLIDHGQVIFEPDTIKTVFKESNTSAIYQLFYDWNKETGLDCSCGTGEFEAFLSKKVDDSLRMVKQIVIDDKTRISSMGIEDPLVSSFEAQKKQQRQSKETSRSSIITDVRNYCFMKTKLSPDSFDFQNQKSFFITFDRLYCDWVRQQTPGTIPVVVLLGTMYTVLLRSTGRTQNDFRSFNQFLSASVYSSYLTDEEEETRRQMVENVIHLNENSLEAKNGILRMCDRNLRIRGSEGRPSETIPELVNKSTQSYYGQIKDKNEAEMDELKKAHEQEMCEAEKKHEREIEASIMRETDTIFKWHLGLVIFLFAIFIASVVAFGCFVSIHGFDNSGTIVSLVIGSLTFIVDVVFTIIPGSRSYVDKEKIEASIRKKQNKDI